MQTPREKPGIVLQGCNPSIKLREKTKLGDHGQSRLLETLSQKEIQKHKRN